MIKKRGFTLAEVLIVLVIAGIIATLSIQTIVSQQKNYGFACYYLYRDLKTAIGHMASTTYAGNLNSFSCDGTEADYNNCIKAGVNGTAHTGIMDYRTDAGFCRGLSRYLGTASTIDCSNFNDANLSSVYGKLNSPNFGLLNKSLVYISGRNSVNSNFYRIITMDINGKSGPNKLGEDIISFAVFDNGELLPVGEPAEDPKSFMTVVKMRNIISREQLTGENKEKFIETLKKPSMVYKTSDKKSLSFKDGYCRAYGNSKNDPNYCSGHSYPFSETFKFGETGIPVNACSNPSANPTGMYIKCDVSVIKPKTPDFVTTDLDTYTSRGSENYNEEMYEISKY